MGQLFAAEFPERVRSLTLVNTFVSPRYLPRVAGHWRPGEDPFPLDGDGIRERFMAMIPTWGVDATTQVEWEVPSKAGDASFVRWMARVQGCGGSSPSTCPDDGRTGPGVVYEGAGLPIARGRGPEKSRPVIRSARWPG